MLPDPSPPPLLLWSSISLSFSQLHCLLSPLIHRSYTTESHCKKWRMEQWPAVMNPRLWSFWDAPARFRTVCAWFNPQILPAAYASSHCISHLIRTLITGLILIWFANSIVRTCNPSLLLIILMSLLGFCLQVAISGTDLKVQVSSRFQEHFVLFSRVAIIEVVYIN